VTCRTDPARLSFLATEDAQSGFSSTTEFASAILSPNKQRIEQLALGASVFLLHRERLNKLIARSRTNTYSLNIEELACGHNRGMSSDLRLCLGAACPFASTRKLWTTMGLELE